MFFLSAANEISVAALYSSLAERATLILRWLSATRILTLNPAGTRLILLARLALTCWPLLLLSRLNEGSPLFPFRSWLDFACGMQSPMDARHCPSVQHICLFQRHDMPLQKQFSSGSMSWFVIFFNHITLTFRSFSIPLHAIRVAQRRNPYQLTSDKKSWLHPRAGHKSIAEHLQRDRLLFYQRHV